MKRLGCMLVAVAGFQALFTGCKCGFEAKRGMECKPDVLAVLPAYCPTPDGMAIDAKGNLIVACPNFVDQSQPACLIKIDKKTLKVERWVMVPPLKETGVACPMGIAFGPDGDLYVCDNQGWKGTPQGQFKGRVLRLRIRDGRAAVTVVAEGMEHPNGVRVRDGFIYVTQSLMSKVKHADGYMVSAVYRFKLDDVGVKVNNTLSDPNILASFTTENRFCPYGVDGLVFDSKGNLFVGNFGDGKLHKITFDAAGNVRSNTVVAETDFDRALDPKKPGFLERATRAKMRTIDGICVDGEDNIYVADFSNNAIARVTPAGVISVLWQNGDTDGRDGGLDQPGEPILWNGRLVVSNFDAVYGPDNPDKVNTKNDQPATLSVLPLR
ncbi:MAG: phage head-tail adapter protein [Kiritimatiellae bacterium]|jgi:sugar lactone lactonase YvrE|nr:phage head-tail adapter protein [Kiritimatiellia bacterium]MDD3583813.1 phage head-tail adapter protein [Kiritimatiellia bacterium]HON46765.1 phage head-tail adapter protein [Kiritimatiellia bacterium]